MRRICGILFCSFCLLVGMAVLPALAVKINTPAPDFTLKDLHGNKVSLSSYRGKVVLLNFWSTTCGPCLEEIPSLVELQREYKGQGLVVLGIALDPSAKPVQELVAKFKVEYINLMDINNDVYFDIYGLFGQPISLIVDRNGVVREKVLGGIDWTSPQVKSKIQFYLKGR
ncbi:MAG: TlpA family protein disulfide reductase [Geobacteraceae bacterium]|nr:TlpA family protein disulfide reductase [Geobacteraceae bacterium]NTW79909.1 TlpA family protein disulfide reductase [Geobacteraceae bacterium]